MPRMSLPVDAALPSLRAILREHGSVVITAEPGTGKTTRVPPALLEWLDGEVIVLEPRRLAAKLSARRVAEERKERLGDIVGYQFRFENVSGPRTRLRYLTEGTLIRRLLRDPELKGVGAVVLDEFHERNLHGDVALAFMKRLQGSSRPDLKIIVMSATLDAESVARYLDGCQVVRVEGVRFPVDIEYVADSGGAQASPRPLEYRVRDAVSRAMETDSAGDILVFLPGMAEIRRCESALTETAREHRLRLAPLHGELSREEQDLAVAAPRPGEARKVILATNIAETSLTIPGVSIVIDSGLARVASHSPWSGLQQLRTRPISKASAIQRAGRAGRLTAGRCIRLYSKGDFESRAPFEVPEIQRADLAQTVLELHALGYAKVTSFEWFEAPTQAGLESADILLKQLSALTDAGTLTEIGQRLVDLPLHPRLARVCLEAAQRGVLPGAAKAVGALSEGLRGGTDFLSELERLPSSGTRSQIEERILSSISVKRRSESPTLQGRESELRRSLLAGFPDRVARRKGDGGAARELLLSAGGMLPIEPNALTASHEWFVVLDAGEKQAHGQKRARTEARLLAAIEPDWLLDLKPGLLCEEEETTWNAARRRVETVSRMTYGALTLDETRGDPRDPDRAAVVLSSFVFSSAQWERLRASEALASLILRGEFLKRTEPALKEWPALHEDALRAHFRDYCVGKSSLDELSESDFYAHVSRSLPRDMIEHMERLAPSHVALARGRRVKVNYEPTQPPWIESRLQDFFGMKVGPAVCGGRVPLTLHLLAPNHRAVQVTSDLAGFWVRNYPSLRRELGRRYPRHSWPEDPLAS